jgi:hypothetical protein
MIHYTCDCCKRIIDASEDTRYVVRMEVYMPVDATDVTLDDDRDHLDEIQDILERIDAGDEPSADDESQTLRFDLCPECRRRFLKNPLGREKIKHLDFSQN